MTWFAHRCHYCGLQHKEVDALYNDAERGLRHQCKFELRPACQARRDALSYGERLFLDILGRPPREEELS